MSTADAQVKIGFQRFNGTPSPDALLERIRLAHKALEFDPGLQRVPLAGVCGTILPVKPVVGFVRGLRPELSRQRAWQLATAWQRETWFGPGFTLSNSLSTRCEIQPTRADTSPANGALGGRPPKRGQTDD